MKTITINKLDAIKDFFATYAHDIEGTLNNMDKDTLGDYLEGDIFIGCAAAATGIPAQEFIDWAVANAGRL